MADQMKNMIIGLFVFVALGIVVFILLYLHPSVGDEKQIIYAWFSDIDKVNVGTRVTFAGKAIGEVDEIIPRKKVLEGPADEYGRIYVYKLKLAIDSGIDVYDIDQISLRTSGLLGERSVAIMPIIPKEGQKPRRITKDDVMYATEAGSVEDTMKEFKEVADQAEAALEQITLTLEELRREEVIKKLAVTIENIGNVAEALNKPEELDSIITNIDDVTTQMAARMPNTWDSLDDALDGFRITMDNTRVAASDVRTVFADMRLGKGTFGGLFVRDDLYLQTKAVMSKIETAANDVNHYGLLFHSDKGWQRLRARRMNLLEKLSSPQEFRNYFNEEMDMINTSLARVYMVLNETEDCSCSYMLGCDGDFRRVFAELLRRAEELEDSLKMYNQQLMDAQNELSSCNSCNSCY